MTPVPRAGGLDQAFVIHGWFTEVVFDIEAIFCKDLNTLVKKTRLSINDRKGTSICDP